MVFNSCTAPLYMYTPPAVNNPEIKEKGDAQVKACFSAGGSGSGWQNSEETAVVRGGDAQFALAVTDKWTAQASFSATSEENGDLGEALASSGRRNTYTRWHAEAGWGYYVPLGPRRKVFFSLFAGGGLGAYQAHLATKANPNYGYFNNRVNRLYLQPSLYGNWGVFNWGISTRLVSQGYTGVSTSLSYLQQQQEGVDGLTGGRVLFAEASTRIGVTIPAVPWLSPEIQFTFSQDITGRVKNMNNGLLSAGLRFNLNRLGGRR
jgi:hypothetical protein